MAWRDIDFLTSRGAALIPYRANEVAESGRGAALNDHERKDLLDKPDVEYRGDGKLCGFC